MLVYGALCPYIGDISENNTMTNIVSFPGRAVPVPPELPPNSPLADQLEAAELALIQAQTAQLKAMTREVNAAWLAAAVRRLVFWLFIAWLLHAVMGPAGAAESWSSRSYYGANGSFAGSSVNRGNQTSFYDSQGRFAGSEIRHGNQRSVYGPHGNFTGSIVTRR
jgi:hypothetical protein